jgi:hypothetical protein
MHSDTIIRNAIIVFLLVVGDFAIKQLAQWLFEFELSHDLAIGSELIMMAISGSRAKKAEREAKKMKPTYEIPQEIFQNQSMYEAMAGSSRVPGQAQMEENIGKSTAQAIGQAQRGASSSVDALSAISGIQQNQNEMLMNLGMMGQQQQAANRDKLAAARETTADYRQQAFDYNKNQPYLRKLAKAEQLRAESKSSANAASGQISDIGMSAIKMGM